MGGDNLDKPVITILNKNEVVRYKPKKSWKRKPILIRILDDSPYTHYKPIQHIDRYGSVLKLHFLDIVLEKDEPQSSIEERKKIYGDNIFNPSHVTKLMDYLKRVDLSKVSEIVVHCTQGERRSVAIGLLIAKYYTQDEGMYEQIQQNNPYDDKGNPYVYDVGDRHMDYL